MRLWPYRMIPYLPNKHLVSQFRECCGIMSMLLSGQPIKHKVVAPVQRYGIDDAKTYCILVCQEMQKRNFKMSPDSIKKMGLKPEDLTKDVSQEHIFRGWHERRYETQCIYMFEEKLDCGMITLEEWTKLKQGFIKNNLL